MVPHEVDSSEQSQALTQRPHRESARRGVSRSDDGDADVWVDAVVMEAVVEDDPMREALQEAKVNLK